MSRRTRNNGPTSCDILELDGVNSFLDTLNVRVALETQMVADRHAKIGRESTWQRARDKRARFRRSRLVTKYGYAARDFEKARFKQLVS